MIRSRLIFSLAIPACYSARFQPRRMATSVMRLEDRSSQASNIRPRTSDSMMDARANRLHGSQATAARGETIALKALLQYCSRPAPSVHVIAKVTMISNTCAKARALPSASPRRGRVANCGISPCHKASQPAHTSSRQLRLPPC
jgi:hypothetical protein